MPAKRNIYRQPDSCFSLYTFIYFVYLEKRYDTVFQQCILSRNLSFKKKLRSVLIENLPGIIFESSKEIEYE